MKLVYALLLNHKLSKPYMTEYEAAISAIDELPGIGRRSAEVILAEIGTDMSRFPSAAHIVDAVEKR